MSTHTSEPSKRTAQHRLAHEVVSMIHGPKEADDVSQQHRTLFRPPSAQVPIPVTGNNPSAAPLNVSLNPLAPHITATNAPPSSLTLPRSLIHNQPIARILFAAGLAASRSEGHRLAINRGAYIGGLNGDKPGMGDGVAFTPIMNWKPEDTQRYIIDDSLLILRIGKWKVKVVKIVSDEEFERLGLDAPGWREWKEGQSVFADEEAERKREGAVDVGRQRNKVANLEAATRNRRLEMGRGTERSPEMEERFQRFMLEREKTRMGKEGPTYADWLALEAAAEAEDARKRKVGKS